MVNLEKFRNDLRSGKSIEEVLETHKIDLGTALYLMQKHNGIRRRRRPKTQSSCTTGEKYISRYGNKYWLRKTVNKKLRSFGRYDSLEDAIKVRDYMMVHGWYITKLETAQRNCGIKKEE